MRYKCMYVAAIFLYGPKSWYIKAVRECKEHVEIENVPVYLGEINNSQFQMKVLLLW